MTPNSLFANVSVVYYGMIRFRFPEIIQIPWPPRRLGFPLHRTQHEAEWGGSTPCSPLPVRPHHLRYRRVCRLTLRSTDSESWFGWGCSFADLI